MKIFKLDGVADDVTQSPCCVQPSGKSSAIAESSSSTCKEVDTTNAFQYDNNIVEVYGAVNSYKIKAECSSCKTKIETNDKIQCCFVCQQMFCTPCLHNYRFCQIEHLKYLAQYKCLGDYMKRRDD